MTILELIQKTTAFFEKKGVEDPRLQIELLLAHGLGLKRMQLYLQFERELAQSELGLLREMVRRRSEREPLQYIVGHTEFFGLEYATDKRALIPRRETEHLIESVLARVDDKNASMQGVDLGTGTGILAITLAVQLPESRWKAADAAVDALALARENAAGHGALDRVEFVESSWWSALPSDGAFDLIVSNPPYVKSADLLQLAPEIREHEPLAALDGGADGLDAYRAIAEGAAGRTRPGGCLALEIGFDQGPAVREILSGQGWKTDDAVKDLQGHDRVVLASLR
jgi:release factor glutamine methyltransferase